MHGLGKVGRDNELVATSNQPGMHRWATALQQGLIPLRGCAGAVQRSLVQALGECGMAVKSRVWVARHLPAWKQGAHIHVVLYEMLGHHHVAHLHAGANTARHAGKH